MKKLFYPLALTLFFGLEILNLGLGTLSAQNYSFCAGDTIIHDLPVYTGFLQWQESDDSLNWTDIAGATYQPYQTIYTTPKYYRAKVSDGSCNPTYSQLLHATTGTCGFTCGTSTITDIDGNVYNTVQIGTQCWLKENLKTTKYSDGTTIPNVTDNATWAALTTGARCWYNNDSASNATVYGALYNWYAINNASNVCPTGWHVPTDSEWNIMEKYLDSTVDTTAIGWVGTDIGGKLKETGTTHWLSPNTGATNSSGFTALPGGNRYYNGPFYSIGYLGYWWSSTAFDATYAWRRGLSYNSSQVFRDYYSKVYGFSVRCVRDL